jgi:hypothetical protein
MSLYQPQKEVRVFKNSDSILIYKIIYSFIVKFETIYGHYSTVLYRLNKNTYYRKGKGKGRGRDLCSLSVPAVSKNRANKENEQQTNKNSPASPPHARYTMMTYLSRPALL